MKKVNQKSVENKFHYCKGDVVIEADFSKEICKTILPVLSHLVNGKELGGFEFSVGENGFSFVEQGRLSTLVKSPRSEFREFEVLLMFGAEAIAFYGNNAIELSYAFRQDLDELFGLKTKVYQLV